MLEPLLSGDKVRRPLLPFRTQQNLGNLPLAVNHPTPVRLGANLYAWGGQSNTTVFDNNSKRLILTGGTAVNIAITPALWFGTDSVNIDDEFILFFGGRRAPGTTTNIIGKLVTGAVMWTDTGWRLPTSTYGNKAVYDEQSLIYVLSGNSNLFTSYEKTTGEQTTLANFPVSIGGGILFMHEGDVFHIGGWSNSAASNKVYKYTVLTNTWEEYHTYDANLYQSVWQGGHYHDGIISYIGWTNNNTLSAIRFDVHTKRFTRFNTNIGYRNCTGVIGIGDDLYLFGGSITPLGGSGFGAASGNRREIYKFTV